MRRGNRNKGYPTSGKGLAEPGGNTDKRKRGRRETPHGLLEMKFPKEVNAPKVTPERKVVREKVVAKDGRRDFPFKRQKHRHVSRRGGFKGNFPAKGGKDRGKWSQG